MSDFCQLKKRKWCIEKSFLSFQARHSEVSRDS
jgi:hypothetical protein